MNENYFELTKDELCFLIICQDTKVFLGYNNFSDNWDIEKAENCIESLKEKNYIKEDGNGKLSVVSPLSAWLYTITHPRGYFEASAEEDEKFLIYFYEDVIITLHIRNGSCELMWLPFIHLAIGQFSGILKQSDFEKWRFASKTDDEETAEYIPSPDETFLNVLNNASQLFVKAHGYSMKGTVTVNE